MAKKYNIVGILTSHTDSMADYDVTLTCMTKLHPKYYILTTYYHYNCFSSHRLRLHISTNILLFQKCFIEETCLEGVLWTFLYSLHQYTHGTWNMSTGHALDIYLHQYTHGTWNMSTGRFSGHFSTPIYIRHMKHVYRACSGHFSTPIYTRHMKHVYWACSGHFSTPIYT